MTLLETYHHLTERFPASCPHLYGEEVDGVDGLWLSVDVQGHPYLLFEMDSDDGLPDLKLNSVEVRFSCPCEIQLHHGNALSGLYTVVYLSSGDPDIVRVFLRLLEEVFFVPSADLSARAVREQLLSIAELFRQIETDLKDVVGLWGELYVIHNSKDLRKAVQAWTFSRTAKYDFVTDSFSLEVKTTLKSSRLHRFSLEQLRPAADIRVFVASILLVENSGGVSVANLMDKIYDSLSDHEERKRFFRLCLRKGGTDIYASDLRVRPLPNNASLCLFDSANIPAPSIQLGDPVTNVRFDVDLSWLQPLAEDVWENISLWRSTDM